MKHVAAIAQMQRRSSTAVDHGNNLRGRAEKGGLNIFRRADAGYELAQNVARECGAKVLGP